MIQQKNDLGFKDLFLPLTTKKAIIFIFITGFIVFFNSLFNGFVGDDKGQFVGNSLTHSLGNVLRIFHTILQANSTSTNSILSFYRPVTFTIIAVITTLFGQSAFFFHLTQIFIHIANSVLVYIIFKKHIQNTPAFFAAIVFLIHPVNSETVSYISDLQDTLFMFFGLISLEISTFKLRWAYKLSLLSITLLASILSKETGFLFFIIVPFYSLLFSQKNRLYVLFPTSISFIIYFFLRFSSAPVATFTVSPSEITMLTLTQRLLSAPKIIFHYLQIFVFPSNLALGWNWTVDKLTPADFYFPLLIDLIFFISLVSFLYYLHRKKSKLKKAYIFFSTWFLVGLVAHIQLVPLDFTVADRWLYFPMVGLLGLILCVGLSILCDRRKVIKDATVLVLCGLLVGFGIRTIVRNSNFYNDTTLYSHDLRVIPNNYVLENTLGVAYLFNDDLNAAKVHFERSIYLNKHSQSWNGMGIIHAKSGDLKKARQYFLNSIKLSNHGEYTLAYDNLVRIDLLLNNLPEARQMGKQAVTKFPHEATFWLLLAITEYKLGNEHEALLNVQKATALDSSINTKDFIKKINQY